MLVIFPHVGINFQLPKGFLESVTSQTMESGCNKGYFPFMGAVMLFYPFSFGSQRLASIFVEIMVNFQ